MASISAASRTEPGKIRSHLDEQLYGRQEAKRAISVGVYNHYKRIAFRSGLVSKPDEDLELEKAFAQDCIRLHGEKSDKSTEKGNMLLIGPSGCGKLELAVTVADYLNIPLSYYSCRDTHQETYIVDIVEDALHDLCALSCGSVSRAERGIVYLIDIDRLRIHRDNPRGRQEQEELVKLIQGTVERVPIPDPSEHHVTRVRIDTTDILFLGSGWSRRHCSPTIRSGVPDQGGSASARDEV